MRKGDRWHTEVPMNRSVQSLSWRERDIQNRFAEEREEETNNDWRLSRKDLPPEQELKSGN